MADGCESRWEKQRLSETTDMEAEEKSFEMSCDVVILTGRPEEMVIASNVWLSIMDVWS